MLLKQHADNALTLRSADGYVDGWAQAGYPRSVELNGYLGATEGFTKKP